MRTAFIAALILYATVAAAVWIVCLYVTVRGEFRQTDPQARRWHWRLIRCGLVPLVVAAVWPAMVTTLLCETAALWMSRRRKNG